MTSGIATKPLPIYLDLDGVMAHFDNGVKRITGKLPHELRKRDMWMAVKNDKTFFENLEYMPDALELWDYLNSLKNINLVILTGLPGSNDGENQKRRWVAKMLSPTIDVIVLPSANKYLHSGPRKVLIDDMTRNIESWVDAGGHGILHTSAKSTISEIDNFVASL